VVVAGGREPSQWEAYPHHQFLHTNGTLQCCANGGCWKSRTAPIGDGDEKDNPQNLCVDVVMPTAQLSSGDLANAINGGPKNAQSFHKEQWSSLLPRCMAMITAEEVIRRIDGYFQGGMIKYLAKEEYLACKHAISGPNQDRS
jgi:hypothetical protein